MACESRGSSQLQLPQHCDYVTISRFFEEGKSSWQKTSRNLNVKSGRKATSLFWLPQTDFKGVGAINLQTLLGGVIVWFCSASHCQKSFMILPVAAFHLQYCFIKIFTFHLL